jgi:hypothetical protein
MTADSPVKENDSLLFESGVETNTDAVEKWVTKGYLDPSKRLTIINAGVTAGAASLSIPSLGTSLMSYGGLLFNGSRAVCKAVEYGMLCKEGRDFVRDAEIIEAECRKDGLSLLPMVARVSYKDLDHVLKDVKNNGLWKSIDERAQDAIDGYRWKIMKERIESRKGKPIPEL